MPLNRKNSSIPTIPPLWCMKKLYTRHNVDIATERDCDHCARHAVRIVGGIAQRFNERVDGHKVEQRLVNRARV